MQTELIPDTEETTLFAEVLLPIAVDQTFTYRIPRTLKEFAECGKRVIAPFGDRKIVTGVILQLTQTPPEREARYILDIPDELPTLGRLQLELLQWIATYYLCSPGEVLQAMLPAALKITSESRIKLHDGFDPQESDQFFTERELLVLNALRHGELGYSDLQKITGTHHPWTLLRSLISKDAITVYEEVQDTYKPPVERCIRIVPEVLPRLQEVFELLDKKPKQEEILLRYLQLAPAMHDPAVNHNGIPRRLLLTPELSVSSLNTLVKQGILEDFQRRVNRFEELPVDPRPVHLNDDQKEAEQSIHHHFSAGKVTLLHGITGSGKTEVFIHLIQQALESGQQVLYLLPEIALTTQMVQRLRRNFGNTMGVYHSRFSDNERVDIWKGLLEGQLNFVVGVRSAVLLPFDNLGLIVVDEEHEATYKQQDPAPRYHARDVAIVLGQKHGARVLLGSATPSMESYALAQQGKYGYVRMDKRFGSSTLPEVILADMRSERKRKTNKGEFSGILLQQLESTLAAGHQALLFQNRRGYSPLIQCESCSWVPHCLHCDVSLTYHQYRNQLLCHYCGYREPLPERCPQCSSTALKTLGWGTEKLEQELGLLFPEVSIARMDLDTTRTKKAYETLLDQFASGKTRILIGTQMITKGLDFDQVNLVGIINVDKILHFPDFRAFERGYQLITQVSGRAGRRDHPGKVIIQTSRPDHPLLQLVRDNQGEEFYLKQLEERAMYHYPPYVRLVEATFKHKEKKSAELAAVTFADRLRLELPDIKVLGPVEPMIGRIRNLYLQTVLIKIPRKNAGLQELKSAIAQKAREVQTTVTEFRQGKIVLDVDPV